MIENMLENHLKKTIILYGLFLVVVIFISYSIGCAIGEKETEVKTLDLCKESVAAKNFFKTNNTVTTVKLGDLDLNNQLEINDVLLLIDYTNKLKAADFNQDNKIDDNDVVDLIEYIYGTK